MPSIRIPEHAGVILLKNAVTFPHGILPLHIFEPRYKKMLEDASKSESIICVANLHSEETSDPSKCVSKIGFAGLIRASEKDEDGRSNLILHSLTRVEFLSWKSAPYTPYPEAHIKPISDINQPITESTEIIIKSLRDAASRFLTQFSDEIIANTNETLNLVNEDLGVLSDVIAQQLLIDENLRQSLIEENNPTKRAETLIRHLRIQKNRI